MKRVGVFYSLGPHFEKTLERARTLGDRVIVIVPKSYALSEAAKNLADDTWRLDGDRLGGVAVFALLRAIRREKYDTFVVMFRSPKLRLFASLSGASTKMYCAPHGYTESLNEFPPAIIAGEVFARLRGLATYTVMWLTVHLRPVRPRPSLDRKESPRR